MLQALLIYHVWAGALKESKQDFFKTGFLQREHFYLELFLSVSLAV